MSSSFSSYANGLQPAERHAYLEKLKLISCAHCPYEIPKELWKQGNECNKFVPKITSSDIFIYLIETKCKEITGETVQAFKSLAFESKQAVRDGWIKSFNCLVLHSGVVLVKAKVCPSQALGTTPHRPWAAIGKTGNVILANCTCAAGLGEVCNHVASLLHVTMVAAEINEGKGCTEDKCAWNNVYSRPDLYKKIEELGYVRKSKLPSIRQPTEQDICEILFKNAEIPGPPPAASLVEDGCELYIPPALKVILPKPFSTLFDKNLVGSNLPELIEKGISVYSQITITKEQVDAICSLTRNQSSSKYWQRYRGFRVTASIFKQVTKTSIERISPSLLKQCCYPSAYNFSTDATRWGIQKESIAIDSFKQMLLLKNTHAGLTITRTGVYLSITHPFLAASPDGIVHCECHGTSVLEVKCPFSYRNYTIFAATQVKTFPLQFHALTKQYYLSKSHEYYYQVQLQMYVTGYHSCYFVVYTSVDLIFVQVAYDSLLIEQSIPLVHKYFIHVIMPEALAGYHYLKSAFVPTAEVLPQNSFLPCFCQTNEPIIVTTVVCANVNCMRKIFHLKCIHDKPNSPLRVTCLWKCDICKKSARIAAMSEKRKKSSNDTHNGKRLPLANITNVTM